ncbi:MAG: hypothetical protein COC23_02845 [Hyphomicrobiales bacterium]|nr:MAG: hypothetical protein COC23_02845 [Hyphomicrobiales bacterium]
MNKDNARGEFKKHREKRRLKGFGSDAGYAERYERNVRTDRSALKQGVLALFGAVSIFGLTFAFLTGYFYESLIFIGLVFVFWIIVKVSLNRRRHEIHIQAFDDARERKNGIDRRWGRIGADKKMKK